MNRNKNNDTDQQMAKVIMYHDQQLKNIHFPDSSATDDEIRRSEVLLKSLGYDLPSKNEVANKRNNEVIVVPNWDELCAEANQYITGKCDIRALFTEDELRQNEEAIRLLNRDFKQIYHMDKVDYAISILAGLVGSAVDILLVGIPKKTPDGLKAGPLSDFVRDYFDKKYPEEEMQKLANSKISKVPFDAQDNRHTRIYVEGLSAYYHRLLQLGHDPVLGFIFGVSDILNGTMTTIDKNGKVVCQVMENYADRRESDTFLALAKQIIHFKSDITTSMGLPAPFMSLLNLLQFGKIGDYDQTIAEIVQGMYYEGYDFIHFCSMSVPVMLIEVITRMGYALKRINEGHSVKDSIPVSLKRETHPKLATMLFISHSLATAANAGKVYFSKNPMSINYPQWLAFAKYVYSQMKWVLLEKPEMRADYVSGKIYNEMQEVFDQVDRNFAEYTHDKIVIYN
ncbi:hypothetical protein H0G69_10405 (plasmid) [Limosilactobacillus mucosae]|uniref:hypothetical protein n=1 Tax=Limosilactobacillus mucosae TaxID=97478 RepID=UPI0015D536BA|nr:hypothetical protein [Limosilactobacillus mucosae]QLI95389.1 hypothetical protein H0G69_10235 [Limosilactobacillus mucosae]QLI95418.1 hypothetical protein H0G69_10405 [Limosilactobacillus mucosae]